MGDLFAVVFRELKNFEYRDLLPWLVLLVILYLVLYVLYEFWFQLVLANIRLDLLERLTVFEETQLNSPELRRAYEKLLSDLRSYQSLELLSPKELIGVPFTFTASGFTSVGVTFELLGKLMSGIIVPAAFGISSFRSWRQEKSKTDKKDQFIGAIILGIIAAIVSVNIPTVVHPMVNILGFPILFVIVVGTWGKLTGH